MRALPIRTKGKGFFKGILLWILTTRNWEIAEDFDVRCRSQPRAERRGDRLARHGGKVEEQYDVSRRQVDLKQVDGAAVAGREVTFEVDGGSTFRE